MFFLLEPEWGATITFTVTKEIMYKPFFTEHRKKLGLRSLTESSLPLDCTFPFSSTTGTASEARLYLRVQVFFL